jgi:hypothetical protein
VQFILKITLNYHGLFVQNPQSAKSVNFLVLAASGDLWTTAFAHTNLDMVHLSKKKEQGFKDTRIKENIRSGHIIMF